MIVEEKYMTKITLTKLKAKMRRLEIGEKLKVYFCPSKCYPNPTNPMNQAILYELERDGKWNEEMKEYTDIDTMVDLFKYYNCNHAEVGERIHFYLINENGV